MKQRLQSLLENQMATLLTRIDEETLSGSNQSDESPHRNRMGMSNPPQVIPEIEPVEEEEEDEISDEYSRSPNSHIVD